MVIYVRLAYLIEYGHTHILQYIRLFLNSDENQSKSHLERHTHLFRDPIFPFPVDTLQRSNQLGNNQHPVAGTRNSDGRHLHIISPSLACLQGSSRPLLNVYRRQRLLSGLQLNIH